MLRVIYLDTWDYFQKEKKLTENREIAKRQSIEYEPTQYAMDFADNYLKDDSKVDVWEGDSLEIAKQRIEQIKASES